VLAVLGVAALVALAFVAPGPTRLGADIAKAVQDLPGLVGWFWEITYDLLVFWALLLMVAAAASRGRRRLLAEQVLAMALALGGAAAAGLAAGMTWDALRHGLTSSEAAKVYPAMRLALAAAVIVTSSPHLARPLRRVGRWLLGLAAVASVALGVTTVLGAVAGFTVGVTSAAVVHLLLGSPGGRPPLDQVRAELADIGLEVTDLTHAALQSRSVAIATGHTSDGHRFVVKVYGRDAWEGQLLSSMWSRLWYRVQTPSSRVGRLQQVEHEAFVTLLAERAGVPVLSVVAAGLAWERDALLVATGDARSAALVDRAEVGPDLVPGYWDALHRLHEAGLSHGDVTLRSMVVFDDGRAGFTDLVEATTAPTETQLATDRAQLLVATGLLVGHERAVAEAMTAIGADGLTELLPVLQPAAMGVETRRAVRDADWDVSDLRRLASEATGEKPPKLQRLRRVTVGSVLMLAILVLVAYAVISAIAGVGLSTLVDEFKSADLGYVLTALLISPLIPVGSAFATLGASVREVRFGPVLALEYAMQFIGLAVPSTAARLALEIRFFQRFGTNATGAVSIGLIDSVSGFVVQIALLLVIALSGLVTLNWSGTTGSSSGSTGSSVNVQALLLIVLVLVVLAVAVLVAVPRVRRLIRARAADTKVALAVLRSPRKVTLLLTGNLAAQVMQAACLSLCVHAFGFQVTLAEAIFVNTIAQLFGGIMPVPGGVGVVEAAVTAGLVAVGVPQAAAVSSAVMYRLVTFYLPPIWGGFAMRWLRRHEYL
jgi:uncharacterized membrane protein YbhN (UPF0104 family)